MTRSKTRRPRKKKGQVLESDVAPLLRILSKLGEEDSDTRGGLQAMIDDQLALWRVRVFAHVRRMPQGKARKRLEIGIRMAHLAFQRRERAIGRMTMSIDEHCSAIQRRGWRPTRRERRLLEGLRFEVEQTELDCTGMPDWKRHRIAELEGRILDDVATDAEISEYRLIRRGE